MEICRLKTFSRCISCSNWQKARERANRLERTLLRDSRLSDWSQRWSNSPRNVHIFYPKMQLLHINLCGKQKRVLDAKIECFVGPLRHCAQYSCCLGWHAWPTCSFWTVLELSSRQRSTRKKPVAVACVTSVVSSLFSERSCGHPQSQFYPREDKIALASRDC